MEHPQDFKNGFGENWDLNLGTPETLTITVYRDSWIIRNGNFTEIHKANPEAIQQIQLQKYGNGFLYNTAIPQDGIRQDQSTVPSAKNVKLRIPSMAGTTAEELEGNTLTVYAYIVHVDKPVGTRDVTRGADLSSTSVAHRHLQKLEDFGLIEKNQYGDYIVKEKTSVSGHVWIGRNLVPRLIFFSLFFIGALSAEITIIMLSYFITSSVVGTSFFFLTGMTALAAVLFLFEGRSLYRKVNPKRD